MNTKQIKKLLLAVLKALRESVCWEKAVNLVTKKTCRRDYNSFIKLHLNIRKM